MKPFTYQNPYPYRNQTLILMQAHGGEEKALQRNWPWLLKSGCDILVTSPVDDLLQNFQGPLLGRVISQPPADYYRLQERALLAFELCLKHCRDSYDSLMLLHYDSIFLAPLPQRVPVGMEAYVYPNPYKQFKANWKPCLPWWFSWDGLEKFVSGAKSHPIDYEQGYLDHWIPAICDEFKIKVTQTDLISYQCTSLDCEPERERARVSIMAKHPFVHGVKHEDDLKWALGVAEKAGFDLSL